MANILEGNALMIACDGRHIGIMEVGKPDGVPLFHFHGSGSSRLEVLFLAKTAGRLGVRLIGLDRPGIGGSDPTGHDAILDWPDIVAEVADRLGIAKFVVAGMSGGAPYALACALRIPERLIACGLIAAFPSPEIMMRAGPLLARSAWWLGTCFPRAFQTYLNGAMGGFAPDAAAIAKRVRWWSSRASATDRALLDDPRRGETLAQVLAENVRQGAAAARRAMAVDLASWGFDGGRIGFAPLHFWHGGQDRIVPVAAARRLATTLPRCQARIFPGDGHFSVLLNHTEDIFRTLTATASAGMTT